MRLYTPSIQVKIQVESELRQNGIKWDTIKYTSIA